MKTRVFLASFLAGAIGLCALTAAEPDDPKKPNQSRQEKVERLLANLQGHFQKMLDLQIAIHDGSKDLHKVIEDTADKKPRGKEKEVMLKLVGKEKDSVAEMTRALELLQAEGTAVAFVEVCEAVCKDMKDVQRRLENGDVGPETQALEKDIIDTLKDMVAAQTNKR